MVKLSSPTDAHVTLVTAVTKMMPTSPDVHVTPAATVTHRCSRPTSLYRHPTCTSHQPLPSPDVHVTPERPRRQSRVHTLRWYHHHHSFSINHYIHSHTGQRWPPNIDFSNRLKHPRIVYVRSLFSIVSGTQFKTEPKDK